MALVTYRGEEHLRGRVKVAASCQPDGVLLPRQVNQSCVGHLRGAWAGSRKHQEVY